MKYRAHKQNMMLLLSSPSKEGLCILESYLNRLRGLRHKHINSGDFTLWDALLKDASITRHKLRLLVHSNENKEVNDEK